jgi:hypothetical protein
MEIDGMFEFADGLAAARAVGHYSGIAARTDTSSTCNLAARIAFFHDAISGWLADPDITLACGRWGDGAISEFVPRGRATLLPARYTGAFSGVREIRFDRSRDHVHLDLGRIHRMAYVIARSVCFDFKPSFEARLLVFGPDNCPSERWVVSVMLTTPYRGRRLNEPAVQRFLRRALQHATECPALVGLEIEAELFADPRAQEALSLLSDVRGVSPLASSSRPTPTFNSTPRWESVAPTVATLLGHTLELRDASLVIYRELTLVEFKTEDLIGVHRIDDQGRVSWQIGALDSHHCHLALDLVTQVQFSAQPAPCQGGALNYSIWFVVPSFAGNPHRTSGYFSVVLNRPYVGDSPRHEVIGPLFALYLKFAKQPWVTADEPFLAALTLGPPDRSALHPYDPPVVA